MHVQYAALKICWLVTEDTNDAKWTLLRKYFIALVNRVIVVFISSGNYKNFLRDMQKCFGLMVQKIWKSLAYTDSRYDRRDCHGFGANY